MRRALIVLAVAALSAAGLSTATGARAAVTPVACTPTLDGVVTSVTATQHTATIVNQTSTTYATVSFFVRTTGGPCTFSAVFRAKSARLGYAGTTPGATRRQGSGTTPLGTYTMSEAFGIATSPGTALPYRKVATGDYWVEDSTSAYYNSYRNKSLGGFRWWLPASDVNGSEYLPSYPTQYKYSIVVNFNRSPDVQVAGRGAGIFVHVKGSGATAGCIGIAESQVRAMLIRIRPGDRITIVR